MCVGATALQLYADLNKDSILGWSSSSSSPAKWTRDFKSGLIYYKSNPFVVVHPLSAFSIIISAVTKFNARSVISSTTWCQLSYVFQGELSFVTQFPYFIYLFLSNIKNVILLFPQRKTITRSA